MFTPAKNTGNQENKSTTTNGTFFGGVGGTPFFQAKLRMNLPGDAQEREADAAQGMRMKKDEAPIVQRMLDEPISSIPISSTASEHEEEAVHRKENDEGNNNMLLKSKGSINQKPKSNYPTQEKVYDLTNAGDLLQWLSLPRFKRLPEQDNSIEKGKAQFEKLAMKYGEKRLDHLNLPLNKEHSPRLSFESNHSYKKTAFARPPFKEETRIVDYSLNKWVAQNFISGKNKSGVASNYDQIFQKDLVDADTLKSSLTEDGKNYLRSAAGALFLDLHQSYPEYHGLALFCKAWIESESKVRKADASEKGRIEVENLIEKYKDNDYREAGKDSTSDPKAMKDANEIKKGITTDGSFFLQSEKGKVFFADILYKFPEGHALSLFSKSWKKSEDDIKMADALKDENGEEQVWLLITPFLKKAYSGKKASEEEEKESKEEEKESKEEEKESKEEEKESKEEEKKPNRINARFGSSDSVQYDPEAVKDCYAIVAKLTDEARKYLNSNRGKVLLDNIDTFFPEGHSIWLFKRYWRTSEPIETTAELKKTEQLAASQKGYGEKIGKLRQEILSKETSEESVANHLKGFVNSAINDANKSESGEKAEQKTQQEEFAKGVTSDFMQDWIVKLVLGDVRRFVLTPGVVEGIINAITYPSVNNNPPGYDGTTTIADKLFLGKEQELKGTIPYNINKNLKVSLGGTTNKLTPKQVLLGKNTLDFNTLKSMSLKGVFDNKNEEKPFTGNVKVEITFPEGKGSVSSKGSLGLNLENKKKKNTFLAKVDYEVKGNAITITGVQKIGEDKDFIAFTQNIQRDQSGTKSSLGIDIKSNMFEQRFKYNYQRNEANQPVKETAQLGLGVNLTDKSKTLSLDADITMSLLGEDQVKAISSFLEYKDTKDFLNFAIGYVKETDGQVQKEIFGLALKKTYDDLSFYIGSSIRTDGKLGNLIAGTEINLGKKSKYGVVTQVEYNNINTPDGNNTVVFTGTVGLKRDKFFLGVYGSTNSNSLGFTAKIIFDPLTWVNKMQK